MSSSRPERDQGFDEFLAVELAGLTRFAGVLCGNRQDAHDVLADALIGVHARWLRISVMEYPVAYVRRMVTTSFLSRQRTAARRAGEPSGPATTPDASAAVADRDAIDRLLDRLPPRQRAVIVLRFYLDLDHAGIAAAMGISAGSARSALTRALANLRVLHQESESVEGERR